MCMRMQVVTRVIDSMIRLTGSGGTNVLCYGFRKVALPSPLPACTSQQNPRSAVAYRNVEAQRLHLRAWLHPAIAARHQMKQHLDPQK